VNQEELDSYRLSAEDNERRFRERIIPTYLAGKPARDNPIAAVIVAQPGAGKTRAGSVIGDSLGGAVGYVPIDSDLYKPFHPDYDRLLRTNDRLMAAATRADGREWMAKVAHYAREHRLDTLIDHTIDGLRFFENTLRPYLASGYRVAVIVLAVPEALSRQGIIHRYHEQHQQTGGGRLTIASKAAASYRGILDGADLIDRERLAHVVAVFRRGFKDGACYYNKLTPDGSWKYPPALRAAIQTEREKHLPVAERTSFLEVQQRLHRELPAEFGEELHTIDELARPLVTGRTSLLAAAGRTPAQVINRARTVSLPPRPPQPPPRQGRSR
jgi:UDP-N-acetylglucosamine kinase